MSRFQHIDRDDRDAAFKHRTRNVATKRAESDADAKLASALQHEIRRDATERVTTLLTTFGVTTAAEEIVPRLTQAGHQDAVPVLGDVEAEARRQRRIARLRRLSRLPPGKTFETLDTGRLPVPIVQRLQELATGAFLETATNVLAFGLPGVGKSHALGPVGHAPE